MLNAPWILSWIGLTGQKSGRRENLTISSGREKPRPNGPGLIVPKEYGNSPITQQALCELRA